MDTFGKANLIGIDQSEIYIAESQGLNLRCVVNGSNPEPIITMKVEQRKLTNKDGLFETEVKKYEFYPEPNHTIGLFKVSLTSVFI